MNLGLPEMIFIFLIALIIFGPRKLPEIGRQIGKAMGEFRRASNEFKSQIEGEIRNLELDEAVKRAPPPQILPPDGSVANHPDAVAALAAETPAEPAAEAPTEQAGETAAEQAAEASARSAPETSAAPGPSEQAKAADV